MRLGRRAVTAFAIAAIIGGALVVERRIPARIDIGGDTLVVNGLQPVAIGARLMNRHGDAIWKPGLRFAEDSGAIAHVGDNGAVTCSGSGDDVVTVSKGALSKRLIVRCRPIWAWGEPGLYSVAGYSHAGGVGLLVGGPAKPYEVKAIGSDRRPITLLQGRATIRDTTVARLEGDLVHPRRVGQTFIDLEFSGGTKAVIFVSVRRSVIDTALTMVAGQLNSWRVPPGYYEVKLEHDSTALGAVPVLAAMNANCARGREGPQHYYCITKENSSFVVSSPTDSRTSTARLSAIQIRQGG